MRGPDWYRTAIELYGQIPEGEAGHHAIIHRPVSEQDASSTNLRDAIQQTQGHVRTGKVEAGDVVVTLFRYMTEEVRAERFAKSRTGTAYTGTLVMSDTNDELWDMNDAVKKAEGHVLVNGLGLGITVRAMLTKAEVSRVTVIEHNPDVVALNRYLLSLFDLGPGVRSRLEIIEADAFKWQPPRGSRYGFVWHDIWDYISADNLPEMRQLVAKYRNRARRQACWARNLCSRGGRI